MVGKWCRLESMLIEKILKDKKQNNKNSKFKSTDFQEIYSFWLDNSVNSNQSAYNMKPINKCFFFEQLSYINDPNVIEKRVQLKNGSKVVFTAPRMVYTKSVHKLHSSFCQKFTQVSFLIFSSTSHTIASNQPKKKS